MNDYPPWAGPPIPDEKLETFALKRIKICRECEHYKMYFCKKCGCFMPVKTKIKDVNCPIDKWQKEN